VLGAPGLGCPPPKGGCMPWPVPGLEPPAPGGIPPYGFIP
jgi:hypothetical protein